MNDGQLKILQHAPRLRGAQRHYRAYLNADTGASFGEYLRRG